MKLIFSTIASLTISLATFASAPVSSNETTNSKQFTSHHLEGTEKLELNADHTFQYVNTTHQYHPVKIEGTWKFSEGQIILDQESNLVRIPSKWEISGNGCLQAVVKSSENMQLCGE